MTKVSLTRKAGNRTQHQISNDEVPGLSLRQLLSQLPLQFHDLGLLRGHVATGNQGLAELMASANQPCLVGEDEFAQAPCNRVVQVLLVAS